MAKHSQAGKPSTRHLPKSGQSLMEHYCLVTAKTKYQATHSSARTKEYGDFEFRCLFRISGDHKTGLINSGIQYRSLVQGKKIIGYQADIGKGYWGSLYDEHRRGKLAKATPAPSNTFSKKTAGTPTSSAARATTISFISTESKPSTTSKRTPNPSQRHLCLSAPLRG